MTDRARRVVYGLAISLVMLMFSESPHATTARIVVCCSIFVIWALAEEK